LGLAQQESRQLEPAIECYQKVLSLRPDFAPACLNLGVALRELNRLDEAAVYGEMACQLQPDSAEAYNNLGIVRQAQGQLESALACFRTASRLQPAYSEAQLNSANVLSELGRFDQAIVCCQAALDICPTRAAAYNTMGNALQGQARLQEALDCYKKALETQPDFPEAHVGKAMALLRAGDYLQGWQECEWRWQCREFSPHRRHFTQPLWNGEVRGECVLLLHEEQGLGDILQFIRYAPWIAERVGRVIAMCPPELASLVQTVAGIDSVQRPDSPLPRFDLHAPLLSLPRIFKTTLQTVPANVPYLAVPRRFALPQPASAGRQPKVGLAWAGNPRHRSDRHRSLSIRQLLPIFDLSGIAYYSLQVGPRAAELAAIGRPDAVIDLSPQLREFGDTAAAIQEMDLVIAVDTAVAHLAGALNKPVWTLLAFVPDFRWMLGREDSPWYPSMRLFRQSAWGQWDVVIQKVTAELAAWRNQSSKHG
jgi:Flp pilus assembly protein TadD